jgi:hypothetical protein
MKDMPNFSLAAEKNNWKNVGSCLRGGDLILSPFEQPIEEERRGDPDQADDDHNFAADKNLCLPLEENLPGYKKVVRNSAFTRKIRFFLDGSIRTKYVGEYVEESLSFPLIVSEIAAVAMDIGSPTPKPAAFKKYLYFVFPHKDTNAISDRAYERLVVMQRKLENEKSNTQIDFMKKKEITRDLRSSLLGTVRSIMHRIEHETALGLPRDQSNWLIMDGAIRNEEFMGLNNTVGVAKSFSRKPSFRLRNKTFTLPAYMKNIGEGERSAVFKKESPSSKLEEKLVFWYERIRTFPPMEPLGGIVKVDMSLSTNKLEESDTKLIDGISAEIYQLRLPSTYPKPRWPSTIYPIRVCEEYMAASFLSRYCLSQIGHELKSVL